MFVSSPYHLLFVLLFLPAPTLSQPPAACPLNFSALPPFIPAPSSAAFPSDAPSRCAFALQFLHLLLSLHLRATSSFLLPNATSTSSCLPDLQSTLAPMLPANFSLAASCGLREAFLSSGCAGIATRADFDAAVPLAARSDMAASCNGSLQAVPACTGCIASLSRAAAAYLPGPDAPGNNITNCAQYPFIYAGAVLSRLGPTDPDTAFCLYLLSIKAAGGGSDSGGWVYGVVFGCIGFALLVAAAAVSWFLVRRRRRQRAAAVALAAARAADQSKRSQALQSISASTTLVKFTYEEIRAATGNFSRERIIGRGGFGNVYKGVLLEGAEVAVKRFKNCSAAGDAAFAHEVEVVASVRHVNLVALHGYCIATTPREGHQRMIVCDLMHNGSLHDHLFGAGECQMSWPVRQKIAVGMARGLAYLHYGAQPAIIHRDIKASNILLDDEFEAKVGDFGLAKFAPEGMTHVSTRVAGTLGYVAPEYALYGQLTGKSDVFSFGVVLLELLSGKKAFISLGEGQSFMLTDWAWSLVRRGRTLNVIQEGMAEPGPNEVMEKYVLVAALCTHPQLHARPTMEQVVKILEAEAVAGPLIIPERPLPIVANLTEIERSASSSGSGQLFSPSGFRSFMHGNEDVALESPKET